MIRWHDGKTRTVRLSSLKLPGNWKERLAAAHVTERAGSIAEVGVINLPVVEWKSKTLVAGADRVAALVVGGLQPTGSLEVRAFDGDADDIRQVRAHENAHRRYDDRDKWIRALTEGAWKAESESQGSPAGSSGGTDASEERPTSAGGASAARSASGPSAEVAHAANDDGYPACGAKLNAGDSTVGQLVDKPADCPDPACIEQGHRNKLLRSDAAKPSKKAKSEARKKVAETVGTTPAAVKQAEYRDRKKAGEVQPRKVHNDDGPAMSVAAQGLVALLADKALRLSHLQAAVSRMIETYPTLSLRFNAGHVVETIKAAAADLRAMTPAAVCCYCIDNAAEDCQACKNDRFLTKAQLRDAPEEMRKRVA